MGCTTSKPSVEKNVSSSPLPMSAAIKPSFKKNPLESSPLVHKVREKISLEETKQPSEIEPSVIELPPKVHFQSPIKSEIPFSSTPLLASDDKDDISHTSEVRTVQTVSFAQDERLVASRTSEVRCHVKNVLL